MPDQELKRNVDFDKKTIRGNITMLSFREARRAKGPVYAAFISDLLEAGCPTAAHHFKCLANKEAMLLDSNDIRDKISNELPLLHALVENAKLAEKAYEMKECGHAATFQYLYQCLQHLEPYARDYDWLIQDLYLIITRLCDAVIDPTQFDGEAIAKIYYKHGMYVTSKSQDICRAIGYFEKALTLTRCDIWPASLNAPETLHQSVAKALYTSVLKYADEIAQSSPASALELAQRAIVLTAEVGVRANMKDFCLANIAHARYLIDVNEYRKALRVLQRIQDIIAKQSSEEYAKAQCKCALSLGVCNSALKNDVEAICNLNKAIKLSQQHHWMPLQAEALLRLGKHFSSCNASHGQAKTAFLDARHIFKQLGDINAINKTTYLLSMLKANELMPYLITLMKESEEKFCGYNNLRLWKNSCKPFQLNLESYLEKDMPDDINCLLDFSSNICQWPIKDSSLLMSEKKEKRHSSKFEKI